MDRRQFLSASLLTGAATVAGGAPAPLDRNREYYQIRRYSLQSGQQETVPFEDELRVVNDYLALEQVRHEERLRLRLDVAPETLLLPIPPMLLQTRILLSF